MGSSSLPVFILFALALTAASANGHRVEIVRGAQQAMMLRASQKHLDSPMEHLNAMANEAAGPKQEGEAGGEVRSTTCGVMLGILIFLCCCGGTLAKVLGPIAPTISSVLTLGIFIYILYTGTFSRWWNGEKINTYCMVLCIWSLIQIVVLSLVCCLGATAMGGVAAGMALHPEEPKEENK